MGNTINILGFQALSVICYMGFIKTENPYLLIAQASFFVVSVVLMANKYLTNK